MFKRNNIYYALFGHCCCFCYQGSGIIVHTAPTPMGPWVVQDGGDIACRPPSSPFSAAASKLLLSKSSSSSSSSRSQVAATKKERQTVVDTSAFYPDAIVGADPTPGQGCLYNNSDQVSIVRSQQNFVVIVPSSTGELQYLWTGDRWQQAPDGIKGHEGQYWYPLVFDPDGTIVDVEWVDSFVLDVE